MTKRAILANLLFALLGFSALGADPVMVNITVTWDKNPEPDVCEYRVYVGTAHGVYSPPLTVSGTEKTLSLPKGVIHYVFVTAVNTINLESLPSDEIVFQAVPKGEGKAPTAPQGLKRAASIRVSIERSEDLELWSEMYTALVAESEASPSVFYRLVLAWN